MDDETSETELTHRGPLCVEVTTPDGASYTVTLAGKEEASIGRSRSTDVRIDHRSISREHARLRLRATIEIEDLGSSNGTRVRGQQLTPHQPIEISVGEAIEVGSVAVRVLSQRQAQSPHLEVERSQRRSGARSLDTPVGWYAPSSAAMEPVLSQIERVAGSDAHVLLFGETGVGKEVCAELIHRRSRRASRSFVRLHCSGLAEPELESALFGHERGAFPGAPASSGGLINSADGGTLFLDEIAEIPATVQVKLLRVLDRAAGTTKSVDVRVIVATRTPLEKEVEAGRFRQDLYFRIAGMTIRIPPLRERADEIVPLAEHFLAVAVRRQRRASLVLSADAVSALMQHSWPGNIHELRTVIERAVVACGSGAIGVEHLSLDTESADDATTGPMPRLGGLIDEVEELERRRIDAALAASGGNQSEAARRLGMSRGALLARLRAWGMAAKSSRRTK